MSAPDQIRHARHRAANRGFTLIELLIVVLIIGILAAIAIPVFMNQKARSYEAQVKAQINTIAKSVETAATDTAGALARDTTSGALLVNNIPAGTVTTTVGVDWDVSGTTEAYCITGWHERGGSLTSAAPLAYDSTAGGPLPHGQTCSATDPGAGGGGGGGLVSIVDDFNRASLGADYTVESGLLGLTAGASIVGGELSLNGYVPVVTADRGVTNGLTSVTLTSASDMRIGLVVRKVNQGTFAAWRPIVNDVAIYTNGVRQTYGTALTTPVTMRAGSVYGLKVEGNVLTFYQDGVELGQMTRPDLPNGTHFGVMGTSEPNGSVVDDLTFTPVP